MGSAWKLGVAVLLLVAASLLAGCGYSIGRQDQAKEQTARKPERPNILFIVTDDQETTSLAQMPRLKSALADRGVTFENAFVTSPLCCPSRTSILTGQYVHNHGVKYNSGPDGGQPQFKERGHEDSNVATRLHDAGYRTALFGKYLNGYTESYTPPSWDDWFANTGDPLDQRYADNGKVVTFDPQKFNETDVLSDKAVEYLEQTKGDTKPFFLYLAPYSPHMGVKPAARYAGKFDDVPLPRPPSFNEEDMSDKPLQVRKRRLTEAKIQEMEGEYHQYLERLQAVDEMVKRLVDTLSKTSELDNTYIFFTSDNGIHWGEHRLKTGKGSAFEEDIRVPLMVRGPGVPAGQTRSHMVINNDFAPTFLDLAGAEIPESVDGRSMGPLLAPDPPKEDAWRTGFLVESYRLLGDDAAADEDSGIAAQYGPSTPPTTSPSASAPRPKAT